MTTSAFHACCFLAERTVPKLGNRVLSSSLFEAYAAWCGLQSVSPMRIRGFSLALKEIGLESIKSNQRWWLDVELLPSVGVRAVEVRRLNTATLEQAWRNTPPLDAVAFLHAKLQALGLSR